MIIFLPIVFSTYEWSRWPNGFFKALVLCPAYAIPATVLTLHIDLPIATLQIWVLRRILGARKLVSPIVPH
jgi:steroid 5-alpha reductase family enzyme